MNDRTNFTRTLAIVGTLLVWLPILAPLVFGLISLVTEGPFRFDYLMPAELFPLAVIGGVLLIWASRRAGSHGKLFVRGLVVAIVSLFGGQGVAVVTGLAHGDTEPGGWQSALALGLIFVYSLAVLAIDVGCVLLLRDLFQPKRPQAGI